MKIEEVEIGDTDYRAGGSCCTSIYWQVLYIFTPSETNKSWMYEENNIAVIKKLGIYIIIITN